MNHVQSPAATGGARRRASRLATLALVVGLGLVAGGCSSPTVTPPADSAGSGKSAESAAAPQQPAPQKEQGTRDNPYPLGSVITGDDWEVTVNSFTADATKEVLAENQFNDKPEAGTVYALANLTVKRLADKEASPLIEVSVDYVTAGGNVVATHDTFVVAPDPMSMNELFKDASATGNYAFAIPEGDAGVLRVKTGLFADGVFVATS